MDEQAGGEMVLLKPDMPGGLHGDSLNIPAAAERPRHPSTTNSHPSPPTRRRADTPDASADAAHRPAPLIHTPAAHPCHADTTPRTSVPFIDTPDLSSRSHVMTARSPDPMSHSRDTPAHTTDQLSRRHVMPNYHPDLPPRRQATATCAPAPPSRRKEIPHHASAALNRDDSNETTDERAHLETPLRTQLKRNAAVSSAPSRSGLEAPQCCGWSPRNSRAPCKTGLVR